MAEEADLQHDVLSFFTSLGAYVFKVISANRAGVLDVHACVRGYYVAVECKAVGKTTSPLQDKNIRDIVHSGGLAYVVDRDNFERVKSEIIRIFYKEAQ